MPEGAPSGVVTIVFTDVEDSTALWERVPDAMREALAVHEAILRHAIATHHGYEVKTEGDSFMVAFGSALDAVDWCLDVQTALLTAPWPARLLAEAEAAEQREGSTVLLRGFRVRMGAHAGEPDARPDPVTGRMDYFGPIVNRASRVSSAAHGGQVLVSERVWREVEGRLPDGIEVADLGEHRLKGLESSERLRQLLPVALRARRFPPPSTLDARKTNLSPHPTQFIGRETDVAAIRGLFAEGSRLVTILGPGGTGKTRLAIRYGGLSLDEYSRAGGGVWMCDATEARTVDGVLGVVGAALGVPLLTGKTTADISMQLGNAIGARGRILLVVDNFEQVVSAGPATIGLWQKLAPEARFLVTSQEVLKLPGESAYELGPLSVPDEDERASESEAVQLFVERAKSARPGWQPAAADMPVIARIVRELDGMALAIELAAARMKVLSPAKLLERLPRRFELLAQANRDASARQATLRGAIDWSWNLLSPIEQAALAQCSVFRGGFSMDALEAVLDLSAFPDPGWPPDLAQALREKSLLRCWELPDRELRFAMYESIRQYAAEKLREAGGEEAAFRRHAEFFCGAARTWGEEVMLRVDPASMRRLSLELENVAVVHRRAAAMPPGVESGRRLLESALSLDPLFALRGPFAAQIGWLDLAIERGGQPGLEKLVLEARIARGCALMWRGRLESAEADFVWVLEASRASRDRLWEGRALQRLARVSHLTGRLRDAARLFEEAAAIHLETGDERFQAVGNTYYADLLQQQRRFDEARPLRDRAVAAARKSGDPQFEAQNLANLGAIAQEEGKLDVALVHYLEAIGVLVPTGDVWSEAIITGYLGALRHERGEFDDAIRCYRSAIEVLREVGDARLEGLFTSYLGGALAQKGQLTEARRVLEDGQRLLAGVGAPAQSVAADLQQALFELAAGVRQQALDRVEAAERAGPGGSSLADESEDVRFGLRLLKRALA